MEMRAETDKDAEAGPGGPGGPGGPRAAPKLNPESEPKTEKLKVVTVHKSHCLLLCLVLADLLTLYVVSMP